MAVTDGYLCAYVAGNLLDTPYEPVTTIDGASTDSQIPTALAVYNATGSIADAVLGRSGLTQNYLLRADASGNAIDSIVSDDGADLTIAGQASMNVSLDTIARLNATNSSAGTAAGVGFTATNDLGHTATFGLGGSNNSTFPDVTVVYGAGYGDNFYSVDGAKSHKFFTDPTDSHNNSSLSYLRFEIESDGTLHVGATDYETLVTDDDDIPNKAYVDTAISSADYVLGKSNLTTQHRMTYVNAAGEITESSSIVTDASGGLNVAGKGTFSDNVLLLNNKELRWKDSGGTERTALEITSGNVFNIGTSGSIPLAFINGAGYSEVARFDPTSGALLIGTTTPYGSEKLGVNGDVYVNGDVGIGATPTTKVSIAESTGTRNLDIDGPSGNAKLNIGQFANTSYIFNNYYFEGGHNSNDASVGGSGFEFGENFWKVDTFTASATPSRTNRLTLRDHGIYIGNQNTSYYYADSGLWGIADFFIRNEGESAKQRLVTIDNTSTSWLSFDRARGTFASPTALQSGDVFGSIVGVGHFGDSTTMAHGAQIDIVTTENWSGSGATPTDIGSCIDIWGVANGSGTQSRAMRITPEYTQIGDQTTPYGSEKLGVNGDVYVNGNQSIAGDISATHIARFDISSAPTQNIRVAAGTSFLQVASSTYAIMQIAGAEHTRFDDSGALLINTATAYGSEKLGVAGSIHTEAELTLKEITTPTAKADYGKIYTKSDNKIYFQDGAGTEHEIAFV